MDEGSIPEALRDAAPDGTVAVASLPAVFQMIRGLAAALREIKSGGAS